MANTSLNYAMQMTGTEILSNNVVAVASDSAKTVTHTGYNKSGTLTTGTSNGPVTKLAYFLKAMSAGAGTIDLTAIPGTDSTFSASGLKVQAIMFENPSTNANVITVSEGASNGYALAGSGWTIDLQPGQACMFLGYDVTPDVGGSAKTIDLAGTLAQTLKVSLAVG